MSFFGKLFGKKEKPEPQPVLGENDVDGPRCATLENQGVIMTVVITIAEFRPVVIALSRIDRSCQLSWNCTSSIVEIDVLVQIEVIGEGLCHKTFGENASLEPHIVIKLLSNFLICRL